VTVKMTGHRGQFISPDNHWTVTTTSSRARNHTNEATGERYAPLALDAMVKDKNRLLLREIVRGMMKAERKAERQAKRPNASADDKLEPARLARMREGFFRELGALLVKRLGN
jgi:hypothetical protein